MANDKLRSALAAAGITPDQLADHAEVDAKTVERWLSGRTPRPRHRASVARLLDRPEHELWPETAIPAPARDARLEIAGAWAHANDLTAPDWRALLRQATGQIQLLGVSLIDVLAAAGATDTLAAKAQRGCEVQVLIAATDSTTVSAIAHELGQDHADQYGTTSLQREIELARGHLEALLNTPSVQLRRYYAQHPNTILRFDEQMLISLHLYATPAGKGPVLHLRCAGDDGLFRRVVEHFDAIWQHSSAPDPSTPDAYPPGG